MDTIYLVMGFIDVEMIVIFHFFLYKKVEQKIKANTIYSNVFASQCSYNARLLYFAWFLITYNLLTTN